MNNSYFESNVWLKLDHLIGLRALGLVAYGTLPTSLFALGFLEVTILDILKVGLLVPFILIIIIPILVLFLIVRERLISWYLFRDGLYFRTIIITILILVLSTLISLAAGYVTGNYAALSWNDWLALDARLRWNQILESFLISITSLVGASTLFITAIKEDSGLPGLPSTNFVQYTHSLLDALTNIKSDSIWAGVKNWDPKPLYKNVADAREICRKLSYQSSLAPQNSAFCNQLAKDLGILESVIKIVELTPAKWSDYFSSNTLSGLNSQDQEFRKVMWKIAGIKINA